MKMISYEKEMKKKKELRKNKMKALAFILTTAIPAILLFLYALWTVKVGFDTMGMQWDFQLVMVIMTFIVLRKYMLDGYLKKINKITKDMAKGKSLREQIDERIPLEKEKF